MTSAQYDLLDSYNANTLAPMAEAAGLAIKQGSKKLSKANLIALMEKEFFTEARIKASLAQLTSLERVVLERLQHRQGKSSSAALKRELAARHPVTRDYSAAKEPWFDAAYLRVQEWAREVRWTP